MPRSRHGPIFCIETNEGATSANMQNQAEAEGAKVGAIKIPGGITG